MKDILVACIFAATFLCGALAVSQTAPATAAPSTKPAVSSEKRHANRGARGRRSAAKPVPSHSREVYQGPCDDNDQVGVPADYENVACPVDCRHKQAGEAFVPIPIDDFVDDQIAVDNGPVCLKSGDAVAWFSRSKLPFSIKAVYYMDPQGKKKKGHPFTDKSNAHDAKPDGKFGTITDPLVIRGKKDNGPVPANGCYLFHPSVEVRDAQGNALKCVDPHIYTECSDPSCDPYSFSAGITVQRNPSTPAVAHKAAKPQAEASGGR